MTAPIDISRCAGQVLAAHIEELAALRVTVFRDWPYLYDGDAAYEAAYLQTYLRSPRAAVLLARAEGRIVGASTCLPMVDETENIQAPFNAHGCSPEKVFYFGESVLLRQWRGQGIGVAFFAEREAHARAVSRCDYAAFCAVERPPDHPSRPAGFVPLDAFWTRRGFMRRPDLRCQMHWKDLDEPAQSPKTLTFWLKSLTGAALPRAHP